MRILVSCFAVATLLALQVTAASAQSNPALEGAFGAFSPGLLGNGGGLQSDFASVREDIVKKMRDGSYEKIIQQGRDNVEAFARLRAKQGLLP
ncbi:hypothetical protein [Microvirga terricola]|uniref:Uncharacterized protein n=1 Tax=Microvirga terricola TaxID=2719797 RepID=A0ABX0VDN2_9HYPH|nr:hypothetical protein [Microvirga terricola]NIX77767.1 hypothetical protein [Microvirga terricola]